MNCNRYSGLAALEPIPDILNPPNGCLPGEGAYSLQLEYDAIEHLVTV